MGKTLTINLLWSLILQSNPLYLASFPVHFASFSQQRQLYNLLPSHEANPCWLPDFGSHVTKRNQGSLSKQERECWERGCNIQTTESHHSTKVNFAIFLRFSCQSFHVNGVRVKASVWVKRSKQLQWSEILEYRALRQISGNQQRWTLWTSSCKKERKLGQTKSPLSAKTTIWSNQLLKKN